MKIPKERLVTSIWAVSFFIPVGIATIYSSSDYNSEEFQTVMMLILIITIGYIIFTLPIIIYVDSKSKIKKGLTVKNYIEERNEIKSKKLKTEEKL